MYINAKVVMISVGNVNFPDFWRVVWVAALVLVRSLVLRVSVHSHRVPDQKSDNKDITDTAETEVEFITKIGRWIRIRTMREDKEK